MTSQGNQMEMKDMGDQDKAAHLAMLMDGAYDPLDSCGGCAKWFDFAKRNGLIVAFHHYSEEMIKFYGAIKDEVDTYRHTTALINAGGLYSTPYDCGVEDPCCAFHQTFQDECQIIEAIRDKDGWPWSFETSIPHVTFEIMKDGEKYCKGIVFHISDLCPEVEFQLVKKTDPMDSVCNELAKLLADAYAPPCPHRPENCGKRNKVDCWVMYARKLAEQRDKKIDEERKATKEQPEPKIQEKTK
jgi:hypothetical protein